MNASSVEAGRQERVSKLLAELRTIDPKLSYYAVTLEGSEDGVRASFANCFTGWSDAPTKRDGTPWIELRTACFVKPQVQVDLWARLGRRYLVASKLVHLIIFSRLGGHALVSEDLAQEHFASYLEPFEVVASGPLGFVHYDPSAPEVTRERPTPQLRSRVLKRDGYRCVLCGERPANNEHITLNLHHIRPRGVGGLTEEENLVTLCHTCHVGLDPHHDFNLYVVGGHLKRALAAQIDDDHEEGVRCYREWVRRKLPEL